MNLLIDSFFYGKNEQIFLFIATNVALVYWFRCFYSGGAIDLSVYLYIARV